MQPGDSCYGLIECRPRLQHDVIHGDTGMPCHCLTNSAWQVRSTTRSAFPRDSSKRPAKGADHRLPGWVWPAVYLLSLPVTPFTTISTLPSRSIVPSYVAQPGLPLSPTSP